MQFIVSVRVPSDFLFDMYDKKLKHEHIINIHSSVTKYIHWVEAITFGTEILWYIIYMLHVCVVFWTFIFSGPFLHDSWKSGIHIMYFISMGIGLVYNSIQKWEVCVLMMNLHPLIRIPKLRGLSFDDEHPCLNWDSKPLSKHMLIHRLCLSLNLIIIWIAPVLNFEG
jgi:hypothetical protein